MHHADGQRTVGAGTHCQMNVGLVGGARAIRIDDDELGAALLGLHGVGHDVDLGAHGIAAPDHHQLECSSISRRSAPRLAPTPAIQPVSESVTQMVENQREYFIAWRSRLMPSRCTRPIVPA